MHTGVGKVDVDETCSPPIGGVGDGPDMVGVIYLARHSHHLVGLHIGPKHDGKLCQMLKRVHADILALAHATCRAACRAERSVYGADTQAHAALRRYAFPMPSRARFVGGPHDGEVASPPLEDPFPDRFIGITWQDGARYAVVGVEEDQLQLRFDDDGTLTRAAILAVGVDPDTPEHWVDR
jgi:hypothetical protein